MLKNITIILSIIVMALSLYSLIYPNDDSLLFLIMEFTFPLLGLFLGLLLLKEKNKVPAILCFSALGFWLVVSELPSISSTNGSRLLNKGNRLCLLK